MASFTSDRNPNGGRNVRLAIGDKAIIAICIALTVAILGTSGVLSGKEVRDVIVALLK